MSTAPLRNRLPCMLIKTTAAVGTLYISSALFIRWLDLPGYDRMHLLDRSTAFMSEAELEETRKRLARPAKPWWQLW
jgi:hypothetical protein